MANTEPAGAPISLEQAAKWTSNYRIENPNTVIAHAFDANIIQDVLKQEGCNGIRIYYAIDDAGTKQLIVVGTDASRNDMAEGLILDYSQPCPSMCGGQNPLNTLISKV